MLRSDYERLRGQQTSAEASPMPTPTVDAALLAKYKINQEQFDNVFTRLLRDWWTTATAIPDCEGKRFVLSILFKDLTNPVKLAIIADDPNCFKEHFKESDGHILFDLCCVCGSEQILKEFFLSNDKYKHYLLTSENALGFTLSSGKQEFALNLAKEALALGKTNPGPIALYSLSMASLLTSKQIAEMFTPKHKDELTRLSAGMESPHVSPYTPHRQTQSVPNGDSGKAAAVKLLLTAELTGFLKSAGPDEFRSFIETIQQEYTKVHKKQKLSHKPSSDKDHE